MTVLINPEHLDMLVANALHYEHELSEEADFDRRAFLRKVINENKEAVSYSSGSRFKDMDHSDFNQE